MNAISLRYATLRLCYLIDERYSRERALHSPAHLSGGAPARLPPPRRGTPARRRLQRRHLGLQGPVGRSRYVRRGASSKNAFFENFANFWRARSRLYQNEIL